MGRSVLRKVIRKPANLIRLSGNAHSVRHFRSFNLIFNRNSHLSRKDSVIG